MNLLQRLEHWGDAHHPKWLDIIRIALGVFLCFKGIEFMRDSNMLSNLMGRNMSFGSFTLVLIGHYIVFAHLIGGFLLAIGMLTRLAAAVQIPILLGAIIFINTSSTTFTPFSELMLSILVLVLLVYFVIAGNGPWSFDWFVERDNKGRRA
jgi:putative oxidoreductase